MKIGIVTITELDNFGNRLQNYALQECLKNYGFEVETIPNYIIYRYRKRFSYKAITMLEGCIKYVFGRKRKMLELIRQYRFEAFDEKYIKFSCFYSEINFISSELNDYYDYFVAGSDQIWNPYFEFNFDFNFLTFADKDKRMSYAASFGVADIPDEKKGVFKKYINNMKTLAVREYTGADIIKELTEKKAEVVLDPTMLLTSDEWRMISKKPKWIKDEKFILTYYLGFTDDRNMIFEKLYSIDVNCKNHKIIDINSYNNRKYFTIAPDEFIWLVDHAEFMVTDSFHGSVFSLLLNTKLIVVNRKDSTESMNSRIDTLFRIFQLDRNDFVINLGEQKSLETVLRDNREKSITYLLNALH